MRPLHSDVYAVAAIAATVVLSAVIGTIFTLPRLIQKEQHVAVEIVRRTRQPCKIEIVEDFPENVTNFDYSQLRHRSTYEVYKDLFGNARREILIMDSSSNLRATQYTDAYRASFAQRGNEIYALLRKRGLHDGIRIRMLDVGANVASVKYKDAMELHREGAVERRSLDAAAIQHAKTTIVDGKHIYITSANLDHLSLHQKGELGVLITDCPRYAEDTRQIYENWWAAAAGTKFMRADLPPFNHRKPFIIDDLAVHTSMSPAHLRESGRDSDLDDMVRVIDEAETKVDISVMDFVPYFVFSGNKEPMHDLTKAVRRAVKRGVQVRLLTMSRFMEWRNFTLEYLKELNAIGPNIQIKILSFEYLNVYMDRKSHGKSIVTDTTALISTSNFTPDYFFADTGLAVVIRETSGTRNFIKQFDQIFSRYWDGDYSYFLNDYLEVCIPTPLDSNVCDAINTLHEDSL